MALYIGKKVGSPTIIKEVESGEVISVENNSFNIELETVSGVLKKKSIVGSGSTKTLDIDVVASDSQFEVFDLELDTADNIKSNEDYVIGFTDDVIFYDIIKEEPTNLVNIQPLEITFPSGAIYSHKYNKQINYNSKTVYFFDYTDMFDYPIIGYEDDGSEVLMNMYVIYNDSSCEMVLLNRIMTPSDVPSGFTDYMFVRQITIPKHNTFYGTIIQQDWTNPKLTANGTMGGTSCACAADSYYSSSYYQYYAFDNSTSSYWRNGTNSTPTWITYYTPDAVFVTSVVFSFNSIASAGRIEGSNDNSTWTTIGTFSGNTSSTLTVECSSTKPYKYIRFYRTSTYSGSYGGIYDMTINGFTLETKWFCNDLITHIQNNDTEEPESFLNAHYYSPNGKFVSSDDQPLISTLEYEGGCLYKYTDDGFGNMDTKSFVIKHVDSDVYKIAITDKTIEEIQGDETIEYVEEIGNYVLPSHYNFDYIDGEPSPNFEIVGTLTDNNGVFSGFTSSSYISVGVFDPSTHPWEYVVKFTTGSIGSGSQGITTTLGNINGCTPFYITDNKIVSYLSSNGNSWDIASGYTIMSVSSNTTYILKAIYNGTDYRWYSYENDEWVLKSVLNNKTPVYNGASIIFGCNRGQNNPFNGNIDLKECYIKINGSYWWTGYTLPFQLKDQFQSSCNFVSNDEPLLLSVVSDEAFTKIVKTPNFTTVGTLTDNDGVFSGFTSNSYIKMNNEIPSGDKEIVFKMIIGNDASTLQNIFASFDANKNSNIFIQSGKLSYWTTSGYGAYSVSSNTGYWMRIIVSNNTTNLYILTDNNYTHESLPTTGWTTIESASGDVFGNNLMCFGCDGGGSYPFLGSIDMKKSYINIDNERWWDSYNDSEVIEYGYTKNIYVAPYTYENNELLGCLVNYEDNGLANVLKAYKVTYTDDNVGVVLSTDDSFTVENMGEKTYLADVVIPNHKLFTYGEKTVKTDWTNPKLTGNGTMGGTSPACQSSGYYSDYYPYRAFEGTTNYHWQSDTKRPQWITYYTPTSIYVDTINIILSNYSPMFYEIQGSNDNTVWDTLVDGLNTVNTFGKTIEISVNSEEPYKYIRLLNKKGYDATYTSINEINIYGHINKEENGWIPMGE